MLTYKRRIVNKTLFDQRIIQWRWKMYFGAIKSSHTRLLLLIGDCGSRPVRRYSYCVLPPNYTHCRPTCTLSALRYVSHKCLLSFKHPHANIFLHRENITLPAA